MLCCNLRARVGSRLRGLASRCFSSKATASSCLTACRSGSQAIRTCRPMIGSAIFAAPATAMLVRLNDGGGVTVLGGHFQLAGPQAEILLGMLPPIVHLQSETDRETLRWAFDRMRQELADSKPGSSLIIQQLAYMIFVQALRLHLDEGKGVGWLFALSDKHVGAAITAIHREPARRWTVAALARRSRHVAFRFRGAISAIGRRRTDRISHALADAARWTQRVARRARWRNRPLARVRI